MPESTSPKRLVKQEQVLDMWKFEANFRRAGECLAGVDEVGRGCLAGDVFAAAVVLGGRPSDWVGIMDSKTLTAKTRETLYQTIVTKSIAYAVGIASVDEINELNILHASRLAMGRALESLGVSVDVALVDGIYEPLFPTNVSITSVPVAGGDAQSVSIAAASIVAKVERDRYMRSMSEQYPGYGFQTNAGYGTREHLQALELLGVTPIHRQSFAPIRRFEQMRLDL